MTSSALIVTYVTNGPPGYRESRLPILVDVLDWAPLPQFIEELYLRSFSRTVPERVVSLEDRARELAEKKRQRRESRAKERVIKGEPDSILP